MSGGTLRPFEGEGKVYFINRYERLSESSSIETVIPALKERFGYERTNCEVAGSMPDTTVFGTHVTEEGTRTVSPY